MSTSATPAWIKLFSEITDRDFEGVDIEEPVAKLEFIEEHDFAERYAQASGAAEIASQPGATRVYRLLFELFRILAKRDDSVVPYEPAWTMLDGSRGPTPSDIPRAINETLAKLCTTAKNPALRARLADFAWLNDRTKSQCAEMAIESLCACIDGLIASTLKTHSRQDGPDEHCCKDLLRRACQISTTTGWKLKSSDGVRTRIVAGRQRAISQSHAAAFLGYATLDLDYRVSEPGVIAKEAETRCKALPSLGDGYVPLALWELAARGHHLADDKANELRCYAEAAECCVERADALAAHAFHASEWLMRAISFLGRSREHKERRNQLRKQLVDVQARSADDFVPLGNPIDVSHFARKAEERFRGICLAEALRRFALVSQPPEPRDLFESARQSATKTPLIALFADTEVLDRHGKVSFKAGGLRGRGDEEDDALRFQVEKHEETRRGVITRGVIEPARMIINSEHRIDVDEMVVLTAQSPFVPVGHEYLFGLAFARFFGGDYVSAASILVPQLENSIRHVLMHSGEDTTTVRSDGTQEDRVLSALFGAMRGEVDRIFTPALAFQLESLFHYRGGPSLRHRFAHGQMAAGAFWSTDTIYACWLMFQLCALPLIDHWKSVEEAFTMLQAA